MWTWSSFERKRERGGKEDGGRRGREIGKGKWGKGRSKARERVPTLSVEPSRVPWSLCLIIIMIPVIAGVTSAKDVVLLVALVN